jgi:hypothetical protein
MLGKFRLVANSPLPVDPLPVVSVAIEKVKVSKVRRLMSNFHDKWEIRLWREGVTRFNKYDIEHSE